MRIVRESERGDFYESFSDLIFATLIVFLVVVMALVLKVRQASETLESSIGGVVTPHRFTGGTDNPKWYLLIVPSDGQVMAAFLPNEVYQTWDLPRVEGGTDPVLWLCEAYLESRLGMMPVEELIAMGEDGLSVRMCDSVVSAEPSDALVRLLRLESERGSLRGMSAREIRDAIGGVSLHEGMTFALNADNSEFMRWGSRDGTEDWFRLPFDLGIDPQRASINESPATSADIVFEIVGDRQIRVGGATMPPESFRAMLAAVSPGARFIIEYRSASGEPEPPPLWVEDEVLFPLGYDGRIVRPVPPDEGGVGDG